MLAIKNFEQKTNAIFVPIPTGYNSELHLLTLTIPKSLEKSQFPRSYNGRK